MIRCSIIGAMILAMLSMASLSYAETKLGYVNPRKIMEDAPQADESVKLIDEEFTPRQEVIIQLRDDISALEKKIESTDIETSNADNVRTDKLKLRELKRDFGRKQDELRDDISLRRNDELAKLQKIVRETIIEIAEKEQYDLILEQSVYVSPSTDITDQVLIILKEKFEPATE